MTQDNDDLLAQVFSVLPTLEGQTDVNSNAKAEQEIVANVRRVSNAFQDFIDKSGVVEPNVVSYEHHTESHQHVTSHVETHNESVTIGGGHHETIGRGAAIAEHHEESHIVGNGASVISTELNPPAHENHHFTISAGVVPQADDNESVVSVRTGLSEATSVSVHSSVSQKSIQIYADAPVIVKDTSRGSLASHKSSVVPESHHSETAHTHERERTISSASTISESTLTGSAASGNTAIENYVFVENTGSHHEHHHHEHHHLEHDHHHEVHHQHNGSQDTATPIAVMKSDPHDALIEEFKARHQRVPSEVSSFVVAPVSQQPPPPTVPPPVESDDESEVVMTVKVTQYEFDSHDVKHAIEHHHEHHTHHEHHEHEVHHDEPVQHGYIHKDEPEHHFEDHTRHNGFDSHAVVGYGTVPRHTEEDDFHFETVEYHEQIHHEPAPASIYNDNVSVAPSEPRSEVPPVFFQSPVLARKAPQQTVNNFDSGSEVSGHHGHHQYHHEDVHNHHPIHRELIPNITGPFVRDELRPAHVSEEHRVVTVPKTISAPVAHVQPVVSHSVVHHQHRQEPRGLPRIDHREALIPHVEEAPVVHKVAHHVEHHHHHKEVQHHHHDHHEHHHVHNERHLPRSERHYHKHDDQMTEIFSGPSVRDLKSQFELGGEVKVHYGTHYISHKDQTSAPIHVESNHHHHHDDKHPHHHHEHVEEHHEPPPVVDSVGQPRLPHRELKEEHIHTHHHPEYIHTHVKEHAHHHHEHKEDQHHHHHHKETVHHHENEELDHHEDLDHHEHHHEPHLDTHQYVAEEEDQLPVSALLGRFGGGAKLRRPDHAEVISRASSVPNVTVVEEVHHHHHDDVQPKSRTVTQSSVSTARSHSTYSVQTSQTRSHASTLTQDHHHNVAAAAPVAAARSPVADHSSLRVVKSVRAFVSEWGQKDFQPPMSPIITVPRLPSSPKSPVAQPIPEPATRKSTVLSEVSNATHSTHQSHTPEHHAIQHIERALHDDAGSVCSRCTKSNRGKSVSSVGSTATTYTTTSHHQEPVVVHIGEGAHPQIPEVHEEFVLTPLAERRALFEQGLNREYSINRKTHGELRPMVNVFTD